MSKEKKSKSPFDIQGLKTKATTQDICALHYCDKTKIFPKALSLLLSIYLL